jgi:hypothetical protein
MMLQIKSLGKAFRGEWLFRSPEFQISVSLGFYNSKSLEPAGPFFRSKAGVNGEGKPERNSR